jgi:predicted aspartyl protease
VPATLALAVLAILGFGSPGPADRLDASVPIDIDAHGAVFVDVRVNDSGPYRFVVDTGSSRSIVSDRLAREVGAPVAARSEIVTSTGSEVRVVVRLASLSVASVRRADVLAPVLPEARLSRLGPGVRGLLGQDFLSAFTYTIDYHHARLRWDETPACDVPGVVRLVAADGRFVMSLMDAAGAPLRLVPDSGAEAPILFRKSRPDEAMARLPRVQVGSVTMKNVAAYVIERADDNADGLLPLHHFSEVTFAAGGACLVAR